MAIVLAIQKWRHYLLERNFIVHTDQKSLKFLLEQRLIWVEHQKWVTKLLCCDFEIQYRPSLENKAADALSRLPRIADLAVVTVSKALDLGELQVQLGTDERLAGIREVLLKDPLSIEGWSVADGCLLYKQRLVLPKGSDFISRILQEFHSSALRGHSGVLKPYKRIAMELFWIGMKKDIQNFVSAYSVCQRNKYMALSLASLLQLLPISEAIWENGFYRRVAKISRLGYDICGSRPIEQICTFYDLEAPFYL